jgi:hypothetical protein
MAKVKIFKKDGTPTPYFWLNRDSGDRTSETVYKRTPDGIKRMKGVHFNAVTNRMHKE